MIAGLEAALPPSLAPFAARLAVGAGRGTFRVADIIRSRAAFTEVMQPFGKRFLDADERAILSYWTQYYFAALVIPAFTVMVRLRWVLPLDLASVRCDLDADGAIVRFWLPDEGRASPGDAMADALAILVTHLRPFIETCAAWSGLSRRVLWCNAGTMLDVATRELRVDAPSNPGDGTVALRACARAEHLLLRPYGPDPRSSTCERLVCCLRFRLPGVADCGATCPMRARALARPSPAKTEDACRSAP